MGAPLTVKNATDTYVNEAAQAKNYGQAARMWLRSGTNVRKNGLVYFSKPWTPFSTIPTAKLRIWNVEAWAGSVTITVQRAGAKWDVSKAKWPGPAGTGATATLTKTGAAAGTMWEIDITSLIQSVANGAPWYGLIITTNNTADGSIYSAQASASSMRPQLVVAWNDGPDEPDGLLPNSAGQVSLQRPIHKYNFNDANGESDLTSQQVQFGVDIATLDAGTFNWDSGEVPTTVPEFDSSIPISRDVASVVTTSASTTISFPASAIVASDVGGTITGTGIPAGATISSITDATHAVISAAATATGTITATVGRIWAGLANLASTAWRVRTKDSAGTWSVYSDSVFYGRTIKGTLTITSPTGGSIWEGSPTVSWTFTGQTQRAYQVAIAKTSDPNNWLWDSGKITSTDTSVSIPFGVIKDASISYRIVVRIWDAINRQATPNDPVYVEAFSDNTIAYDAAVTNVSSLSAGSDPLLPIEHLTWTRTVQPDSYQLQRSEDGGTTWQYIREVTGAEASTGGSNYALDDIAAAQYTDYVWRVLPIVAGRQAGGTIPTTTGQVRKLAPFLVRKDGTDAVCFLNPKRDREYLDQQGVYETQAGNVLVTQTLGGSAGHVEGRFTGDSMPGVTAKTQAQRFKRLRADSGQALTLYVADEALNVVAYNMQIDTITDAYGITYQASFDWIEVPT